LNILKRLLIFSFLPILIGGLIYIGFRVDTLLMFRWFEYLNIINLVNIYRDFVANIYLPEFFVYSLPNGLWAFSFIMFISIMTTEKIKSFLILFCILITIGFEIFQNFEIVPGTFCLVDFLTNTFFVGLSLVLSLKIIKKRGVKDEII
jgi:hypothetical protein